MRYLVFLKSLKLENYSKIQLLFISFSTGKKPKATIYTFRLLSNMQKRNKPEFQ